MYNTSSCWLSLRFNHDNLNELGQSSHHVLIKNMQMFNCQAWKECETVWCYMKEEDSTKSDTE